MAALTLAALAAWEFRRQDPLIDLRYFRNRSFTAAVLIAVFAFADMGGFLFLIGIYLQDARGSSAIHAGLDMLPTAAAMAVCPSLAAWVTAKVGSARPPLLFGGLALMLGTYAMCGSPTPPRYLPLDNVRAVRHRHGHAQRPDHGRRGVRDAAQPRGPRIRHRVRQPPGRPDPRHSDHWLAADHGGRRAGQPASAMASHPAWHLLFWWAFAVAVFGLFTSRAPARHRRPGAPSTAASCRGDRCHSPSSPSSRRLPRDRWPSQRPLDPPSHPEDRVTERHAAGAGIPRRP